ncbi:hypothetical protein MCOR27_005313 [Pyricularia oryzae]|uniref:Major facilitator superfamily (MFS) profile domain-containing protein n=1 Tax=Pyricularia grisea TaxID=148305 RepID=A0ABQ8NFU8_PYRGI|nr:hypothetical protein MCOR26_007448 [Pyricularia oryzae]KAI6296380.1 hypothetical protein MCOR33_006991 [Pyricularia grisea]KAI6279061.1 hypothetical protein MCOR27_005313 [Pyricularia oryzae]KAI6321215.1 hypothetical protein MCOR30_007990 [Pyricularia oryzae]KAI6337677.1 hypothetical protein MCOR28_008381 [Pyricularia oryzae]
MGWGVVEDRLGRSPPGTVKLSDSDQEQNFGGPTSNLKKRGNVVLQPQPSDDPNDPLNWSQGFKIANILVIAFGSAVSNALTTMVQPGIKPMAEKFGVTEGPISSWVINSLAFWTSLASFFVVAGSDVWGRRPFYLAGILILTGCNVMAYAATTFPILVVARTLTGLAAAPIFSLATASVSDIFFVHERGIFLAVWGLAISSGGTVSQIITGFLIDAMGVESTFLFASIILGVLFIIAYFVLLESAYFKPRVTSAFSRSDNPVEDEEDLFPAEKVGVEVPVKRTYRQNLAVWNGRLSDMGFWAGAVKPLGMLTSPIVAYSALLSTVLLILLAGVPTLVTIVIGDAPYSLSPSNIGLTNIPLIFVGLIAGPTLGFLSDAVTRMMARSNGTNPGVAEPEFRLVLLLLALPITVFGLVGMAMSMDERGSLSWIMVWNSVILFGSLAGTQTSVVYVVDAYAKSSAQAFVTINGIASLVSFVGIEPLINWFMASGPMVVLSVVASAQVVVAVGAIPMYIWGKRIRAWYSRASWAQKFQNV